MIVAMAGLPGTGESTLAGALATQLHAVVLDKDRIRAGLFPSSHVDYTDDQNDFCVDIMYRTAEWLLRRDRAAVVILDGCTYTRANQIATLGQMAMDLGEPLRIIECICDDRLYPPATPDPAATDRSLPIAHRWYPRGSDERG